MKLEQILSNVRSATVRIGDIRKCSNIEDGYEGSLYKIVRSGLSGMNVKFMSGNAVGTSTFWSVDSIGFDQLWKRE